MRGLIATVPLLLLAACGDGTAPVPSVAGEWEGGFMTTGTVSLDLDQSGRTVTGSGTSQFPELSWSMVVTGSVTGSGSDARVTMAWDSDANGGLTFEGDIVSPTQIVGLVTSGAGQIAAVTLTRAD